MKYLFALFIFSALSKGDSKCQPLSFVWTPKLDQKGVNELLEMQTSDSLITSFIETHGTPVYIQGIKAGDSHFELGTQAAPGHAFTLTPLNMDLAIPSFINPSVRFDATCSHGP